MKLITYQEATERYRCSRKTLERAIKKGEIDAYRPGRKVLLDEATVKAWFKSRQIRPVRVLSRPRRRKVVNLG